MGFDHIRRSALCIKAAFDRLTATDLRITALLIVLASLTRLPFLFHPLSNISDEFLYADFAMLVASGTPVFDIHPPLVRMVFSFIIAPFHFTGVLFPIDVTPFGDFPFAPLRAFVLIFGILFPVLMYRIGKLTGLTPRLALLIGLFVVFDNMLTLYGAVIMPDMILLFLNMTALACVLAARDLTPRRSWAFTLLGGVVFGLALSTKWTALGMLPVLGLLFLFSVPKGFRKMLTFLTLNITIYLSVFGFYFTLFTPTDRPPETIVGYYTEITKDLRFPDNKDFGAIMRHVYDINRFMLFANTDKAVIATFNNNVPSPALWPLGQTGTLYWWEPEDHNKVIYMMGNLVLWSALLFTFLFGFIRTLQKGLSRPIFSAKTHLIPLVLMVGYLANYIPFFLISRPMYLYHYLTSLAFLILLAPHILPDLAQTITTKTRDPLFTKVFFSFLAIAIIVCYVIAFPVTYGW